MSLIKFRVSFLSLFLGVTALYVMRYFFYTGQEHTLRDGFRAQHDSALIKSKSAPEGYLRATTVQKSDATTPPSLESLVAQSRLLFPQHTATANEPQKAEHSPLPLPTDYSYERPEAEFCKKRFSRQYLFDLRDSATSYCTDSSTSPMTCFNTDTAHKNKDGAQDVLCIAKAGKFNAHTQKVELGCEPREFTEEEKQRGVTKVEDFFEYSNWFGTGARYVFKDKIELKKPEGTVANTEQSKGTKPKYTILFKRESNNNFAHFINEIIAISATTDVLQMAIDPATNQPFWKAGDDANTQILLLENLKDQPHLEMLDVFAKLPMRKAWEMDKDEDLGTIIVPLAGISNPMWAADWTFHGCHTPWDWVRVFRDRVLKHFNLLDEFPGFEKEEKGRSPVIKDYTEKMTVTVLRRKGTRELRNEQDCVTALRKAYPDLQINNLNLADHELSQQFNITHNSDVLVGVHGAGLAHTLFLRPGSAVVELQPEDVTWAGHRNEASGLDIDYFMTHGVAVPDLPEKAEEKADGKVKGRALEKRKWSHDAIVVEPDLFVRTVGSAIHAVYGKRASPHPVV